LAVNKALAAFAAAVQLHSNNQYFLTDWHTAPNMLQHWEAARWDGWTPDGFMYSALHIIWAVPIRIQKIFEPGLRWLTFCNPLWWSYMIGM